MKGFHGCIDIEGWHDPVYRDDLEMTGQVHALNYLETMPRRRVCGESLEMNNRRSRVIIEFQEKNAVKQIRAGACRPGISAPDTARLR